jgi:hypothetical protein
MHATGKKCTRCLGNVFLEDDPRTGEVEEVCLQCGDRKTIQRGYKNLKGKSLFDKGHSPY